jgi:5-methylcytosine-specific restriction endonuclease McrA
MKPLHDLQGCRARRERERIFNAGQTTCVYCSSPLTLLNATLEHILPLAFGGTHAPSNLTLACHACNHRRGAMLDYKNYEEYGEPVRLSTGEWRRRKRRKAIDFSANMQECT